MPVPSDQTPGQTPEQILRPYLDATLSFACDPVQSLFTLFYMQQSDGRVASLDSQTSVFHIDPYSRYLPEIADSAVTNAETIFWRVMKVLQENRSQPNQDGRGNDQEQGESRSREIESLWPPLEYTEDNDDW